MELEWIKQLRSLPGSEFLGDDAAVLGDQLLTVDMLTEQVDFLLARTEPEWIGRKALAVNLSDIAAMGGTPTAILVAVSLPIPVIPESESEGEAKGNEKLQSLRLAERLYAGMRPLIDQDRITLLGGDTNRWHGGLVLSITALGRVGPQGPWRRSGGRPGDLLLVTGPLGGSILEHQFSFEPRVFEAVYLNEHHRIHAAIDLSDGLSLDLHRLAEESRVGAILEERSIPITEDARTLAGQDGRTPLDHALADGEDFELLLAVPESEANLLLNTQPLQQLYGTTLYCIGKLTEERQVQLRTPENEIVPLPPKGFLH